MGVAIQLASKMVNQSPLSARLYKLHPVDPAKRAINISGFETTLVLKLYHPPQRKIKNQKTEWT